jgi:hypothetical protein
MSRSTWRLVSWCITAPEHGPDAAAQTLAANLLDTMINKHFAHERVLRDQENASAGPE